MKSELLTTLQERGFIHQSTDLDGLDDLASKSKITSYIGFDLTANSLHVGSLIQIMVQRWMAKFGHYPLTLLGEATTRIGDPSGKSASRPMLSDEDIQSNRQGIEKVLDRLLTHKQYVSNASWFNDETSFFGFLQDYGSHFTINRMLTFDSVKTRLDRQEPLTFLEFNYMLMQAVDFLKLYERRDCVLQIGGSDQWGNIVNGVELTRRVAKGQVYGLTTPLMTNVAGEKMGKTANGAVWLDPDKTSAFEFYQFWRNVEDAKVGDFLRLFTELEMDEITRLELLGGAEVNEAKIVLATEVTALVHGRATADSVAKIATEGFNVVDAHPSESLPVHIVQAEQLKLGTTLAQLMLDAGMVSSKTEAHKLANNNGVKLNGHSVTDVRCIIDRYAFEDDRFLLSVGKKKFVAFRIEDG
jgi:tyrosyl-tRNA synthetase